MICMGVFALVIAAVQRHASLREMKESYGMLPKSVAGPLAGLIGLLGLVALAGVLVQV